MSVGTEHDWPDVAGRIVNREHVMPVRVYYEDTDHAGVVYHASYIRFCERGRSDFLRLIGVEHKALKVSDGGPDAYAVRRIEADFMHPATIDDLLIVRTRFVEMRGASFFMHQNIDCGGRSVFSMNVLVVPVSLEGKPRRFPKATRDIFLSYLFPDDNGA